jgi:NAD-dependent SIR2 family protein deacetylase
LDEIDAWLDQGKVDLILVIGTTATVYPAAGYVDQARRRGARVAVVNMDGLEGELGAAGDLKGGDFLFKGDAGKILPVILNCGVRPWRGNGVIAIDLLPNGKIIAIWVVTQPVLT